MQLLIVEDEALVARRLRRLLGQALAGKPHHCLTVDNFAEARTILARQPVDLLFLDLNLHGKDGFELLAEAAAGAFETVIVSANRERALEAFDYGVLDFIAKPFTLERLQKALARFEGRSGDRRPNPATYLAVRSRGDVALIPVDRVVAIHGADNYSEIETQDGRRLLHDKGLDRLAALLPPRFVRIHRSHIVDWDRALTLESKPGSRYFLVLETGKRLPVGRARAAELKRRLI